MTNENNIEKLRQQAEDICQEGNCNHVVMDGYTICICCLHGICEVASQESIDAKAALANL